MRRATLKSLLAHKLRLALTATAVVLGVAFISGTLVLTDTLNATCTNLFGDAYRNVDVAVRAKSAFGTGDDREPVPAVLLFLLVFAGIALFVGTFIIANTFSMLVAQRTRELALLRAVGASRRQVTRSVLAEALAVGLVGETVGLGLRLLVAVGLRALLGVFGISLPAGSLVVKAHTPLWAYAVGVVVTTTAAYVPARRAAKIPPVAALREEVSLPTWSLRRRAVVGTLLTAVGAGSMATGLAGAGSMATGLAGAGGQPAALVGLGAMLVFLGVATLSPFVSRPVVCLLGAPLARIFGVLAAVLPARRAARLDVLRAVSTT
jgi:putative ABC transport system permease protein